MNLVIDKSLKKAMSYREYKDLVKQLVEENSTTGNEKTEALANYTKLNDRRMKRWDKTVKLSDETKDRLKSFDGKTTWLVLTESWCGDAAHVIPVLNKIADFTGNIDLKLVLRDENPELMDTFLTDGNRAIPKLIMIDNETSEIVDTFGPRPSEATSYVNRFKAMNGKLTPEFKEDLQHWYNKDKGKNIIEDVTEMLCELKPNVCQ
ncbi:thioredoxin family protein [Hyunsoonleella aestuarii]|uniref:Thioredoxin family protein n=1 Tax=Hyunsoonleella aestuarii TaxID=912802 RepID=A0ABP8EAD6_9FLAO|nr:thioredoxin family protein [Hyunsoonleella aestuarii]